MNEKLEEVIATLNITLKTLDTDTLEEIIDEVHFHWHSTIEPEILKELDKRNF